MEFNETYTRYWEGAVKKSIDGTIIAGPTEASDLLKICNIGGVENCLDLGCSTGRMYEVLSSISQHVYGIDPDGYAVSKAREHPYSGVHVGAAEKTGHANEFFDLIFCWAAFDVISHAEGLCEANRILKKGGRLLFTGKSANYLINDALAFEAEKNAYLKGFPNRFSNLTAMQMEMHALGYEIIDFISFARRGDLGKMNYRRHDSLDAFLAHESCCYEYLMIVKKISSLENKKINSEMNLDRPFSITAFRRSEEAGFDSAAAYFKSIGLN